MTDPQKYPEAYQCLLDRRSIREFTEEAVSEELVKAILMGRTAGPFRQEQSALAFRHC